MLVFRDVHKLIQEITRMRRVRKTVVPSKWNNDHLPKSWHASILKSTGAVPIPLGVQFPETGRFLMSGNTHNQIEQRSSNPAKPEVLSSTTAPQKPMTAAQAALARARAARAGFDVGRPVPKPGPENGMQCAPTPTVSTHQLSLVDEIIGMLDGLEYLTFVFLADGPTTRDQAHYCGPTVDIVVRMASDLVLDAPPEVRQYHWFRDPKNGLPDKASREKTIATMQSCLDRLRAREDIDFALVWYVEGETKAHLELAGFTLQIAFSEIRDLLGDAVHDALCF
jgi:hypothetical protein